MRIGDRFKTRASELPAVLREDSGDGRGIAQFVKIWVAVGDEEKADLIATPASSGSDREKTIAAAVVHGMCRHYEYKPPDWVFDYRSPVPIHPITDRRLTVSGMRARIIMTASPVCRHHNVWFAESLVSARRDIQPPKPPPHFKTSGYAPRMVSNERRMTKDEILGLFRALDLELSDLGSETRLIVAGGAVMSILVAGRATYDVDALHRKLDTQLQQAAVRVAQKHDLPDDWLNTHASAYVDLDDPGFSSHTIYSGASLRVLAPDFRHMLAMKLVSARDKDLADAAWLARKLGLTDRRSLHSVVTDIYGNSPEMTESVVWAVGYIDHVLDEIDLQQQLEAGQQIDQENSP